MDGNRRYAKRLNEKVFEGHKKGFKALEETLRVCYDLGVKVVTVYAFSIENFKRSQDEVDQLMDLLVDKMEYILKSDLIQKHGVRINIIGDISLLPPHVQKACAKISLESENNSNAVLNIALAYTSRHEITNAIKQLIIGVEENQLKPDDINESLFEYCLYLDSQPDILIRTSGETRLSDFLLWQSSFSCLLFFKVLWPEFSNCHMFLSLLFYQREHENIKKKRIWYREQLMQFEKMKIPNESSRKQRVESFKLKKSKKDHAYLESLLVK